MTFKINRIAVLVLVLSLNLSAFSQKFGVGVSAIYNLQTESFAAGLRAEFPYKKISIVPQISYYPSFNKITEFYGGISLHLNLFHVKNWVFYGIANGSYNGWINYETSPMQDKKFSNWDAELGGGLTNRACLRPFIEYRYNFKWKETNLQIGIMYFFKCKKGKGNAGGGRKNKKSPMSCPAYN